MIGRKNRNQPREKETSPPAAPTGRFEVNAPSGWAWRALLAAAAYTCLVVLLFALLPFVSASVGFYISVVALGWPLVAVLALVAFVAVDYLLRAKLVFDPEARRVGRLLIWRGEPRGLENPVWLKAEDMAELHLHRCDIFGMPWEALFLAPRDGKRVLLYEARPRIKAIESLFHDRPPRLAARDLDALAGRIAAFAGCAVRRLSSIGKPDSPPALPPGGGQDG